MAQNEAVSSQTELNSREHATPWYSVLTEPLRQAACWRVILGTMCSVTSVSLMNRMLFPLFDSVFTYARDVSITFEACVLIALAIVAMWVPRVIKNKLFNGIALALCFIGAGVIFAGLRGGSAAVLVLGACMAVTGRAWTSLLVNLAAVSLTVPHMVMSILVGTLFSYPLQIVACLCFPAELGAATAIVILPVLMVLLCAAPANRLLDDIAASQPVADVSVTRPASFLPLTHTLYVFQFVMFIGYGFALRFGEVDGSPAFGIAVLAAAIFVLLVIVVLNRGNMPFDTVCNVSVLLLLAGFILVIINIYSNAYSANTVLAIGNALYGTLMSCTLIALAGRNRAAGLSILGWANGIAALGTTLGAGIGTTGNEWLARGDYLAVMYMVGAVTIILMAYILFFLRGFNFARTISGVMPPENTREAEKIATEAGSREDAFLTGCQSISEEYQLTPREAEIFVMLAKGRDRQYIEDTLQVSRNTVKAHVKHIYTKLEIHSHVELIDLVMRTMRQ